MPIPAQPTNPKPDTNFISTFKQGFPEYANMDNATLSKNINTSLSKNDQNFFSTFKQRFPGLSSVSNDDLSSRIKSSLQATANVGGLSSGDQEKDLGITDLADTSGFSNTTAGKIVGSFVDGIKNLGTYLGSSLAISGNMDKYKTAVQQHLQTAQNLNNQIQKDQTAGKDTTRLQKALDTLKSNTPQLSDFFDQTTLIRLNQSAGKNIEEAAGTAINAALDATIALSGVEKGAEVATKEGVSLGSKILKGAKLGASYGATAGLGGSLSKGGNVGQVAESTGEGGLKGGVFGGLGEGTLGGISNKLKGESLWGNLAKVPEKLEGDEGALANVPNAKNQVLEAQDLTKKNIKNPDLPTASDVQGNKIHQDILIKSKAKLDTIGAKMQSSLQNPAVGGAPVDLGSTVSDFESELNKRPPVATNGDNRILNDFTDDLNKIGASLDEGKNTYQGRQIKTDASTGNKYIFSEDGEPIPVPKGATNSNLVDVDNFLRKWQSIDASKQMQNNSVGALIDSTVHDINEAAKTSADKAEELAGVVGHPYRESNDEYSKLVSDYNDAKDELGTKRVSTGQYDKSGSVFRNNATSQSSPAWKNLAKATGTQLGQPASITKFIEDIYSSPKPYDIVKNARVSYNLPIMLARNLQSVVSKGETDPDAVVQKIIQYIDSVNPKGGLTGKLSKTIK